MSKYVAKKTNNGNYYLELKPSFWDKKIKYSTCLVSAITVLLTIALLT